MESLTELTELELIALKSITWADFYENGRDSVPWDFSVLDACPLKGKTRSGAFGSLVKKELVFITEGAKKYYTDKDGVKRLNLFYDPIDKFGTIRITKKGYEVLDELGLIDEDGYFKE